MIHEINPLGLLKEKCLRGISLQKADYTMINNFCSGNSSMDNFLKHDALLANIQREATTTIVIDGEECIAYFTIKEDFVEIEVDEGKKEKFPCLELARLAVSAEKQNCGIGAAVSAYVRNLAFAANAKYITTQALLEKVDWYKRRGFKKYGGKLGSGEQTTLYMVMDLYDGEMEDSFFEQFEEDKET